MMVINGSHIPGSSDVSTGSYSIIPGNDGLHAIAKVNRNVFLAEHPPTADGQSPVTMEGPLDVPTANAGSVTGDAVPARPMMVSVAYTKEM